MQAKRPRLLYWDSPVFLSYINKHPDRWATIDKLWEDVSKSNIDRIITSSLSIVEVAFANIDGKKAITPQIEADIEAMWNDPTILRVDFVPQIALIARYLMRDAVQQGWSLKPLDAIHLATARWADRNLDRIEEVHTYDKPLAKYGVMIGIPVKEPHVLQPRLFGTAPAED